MLEDREYQKNAAEDACNQNSIVVLPTGMGKTAVALRVINRYSFNPGRMLFLAPTRVLAVQHAKFLKKNLDFKDIGVVTGEDDMEIRAPMWNSRVVCCTPETARNDISAGILRPSFISLLVVDEVHRAVGAYAYTSVIRSMPKSTRLLGLTATLPARLRDEGAIESIGFTKIIEKSRTDADVAPYSKNIYLFRITVSLPPSMISIKSRLDAALDRRYVPLRKSKLLDSSTKSLSNLIRLSRRLPYSEKHLALPLYNAIRIHHMKNMLEAHGTSPFLSLVNRTMSKNSPGIAELFTDTDLNHGIEMAKSLSTGGIEHPKLDELGKLASSIKSGAIIFTSYRDSVSMIHNYLEGAGHTSVMLTGKAGRGAKAQSEAISGFSGQKYKFMVATHVGEEGLDISEASTIIFYDSVPSSIRLIQRIGRTGRTSDGTVFMLITKNTIDEGYYWAAKKKIGNLGLIEPNAAVPDPGQKTLGQFT